MARVKAQHQRHVPLRTCIICRQTLGKRELVRVVRTPDSGVQVDPTGKRAGRGAYLCRSRACWDQALSGHRLGIALKTNLDAEELTALRENAVTLAET